MRNWEIFQQAFFFLHILHWHRNGPAMLSSSHILRNEASLIICFRACKNNWDIFEWYKNDTQYPLTPYISFFETFTTFTDCIYTHEIKKSWMKYLCAIIHAWSERCHIWIHFWKCTLNKENHLLFRISHLGSLLNFQWWMLHRIIFNSHAIFQKRRPYAQVHFNSYQSGSQNQFLIMKLQPKIMLVLGKFLRILVTKQLSFSIPLNKTIWRRLLFFFFLYFLFS